MLKNIIRTSLGILVVGIICFLYLIGFCVLCLGGWYVLLGILVELVAIVSTAAFVELVDQ